MSSFVFDDSYVTGRFQRSICLLMAQPVVEAGRAETWMLTWCERSVIKFCAELARAGVRNDSPAVAFCSKESAGELKERTRIGAGDLNRRV